MVWTAKDRRRLEAVVALVLEKPEVFAVQGWVQTVGRRHRLRYREGDVVRSLSLGNSQELADEVAELLKRLQWAEKSRRYMKRLCRQARTGRRHALAVIDTLLDGCGVPREPPECDEFDVDSLDNAHDSGMPELPELPELQEEIHPTGGKRQSREEPFFEGLVPDLTQPQLKKVLKSFQSMMQASKLSK